MLFVDLLTELNKRIDPARNKALKMVGDEILRLSNKEVPFDYILSSYIHMSINRLFRSKQRKNEMVIYDFLNKYYLWKANTQKK